MLVYTFTLTKDKEESMYLPDSLLTFSAFVVIAFVIKVIISTTK